eukprot:gene5210-biopygen22194
MHVLPLPLESCQGALSPVDRRDEGRAGQCAGRRQPEHLRHVGRPRPHQRKKRKRARTGRRPDAGIVVSPRPRRLLAVPCRSNTVHVTGGRHLRESSGGFWGEKSAPRAARPQPSAARSGRADGAVGCSRAPASQRLPRDTP